MEDSEARSRFWTSRRAPCAGSRPERIRDRVPGRSERAVATMGRVGGVLERRCRVRARPMPREAGATRAHAMAEEGWRGDGPGSSAWCSLATRYICNAQALWGRARAGSNVNTSRQATRFRKRIGLSTPGCLVDTCLIALRASSPRLPRITSCRSRANAVLPHRAERNSDVVDLHLESQSAR